MKKAKCKNCGIEIIVKNSRKTFCSQNCRKSYTLRIKDTIEKTCLNCGITYKTKNENSTFCSTGCATSYRHKDPVFKQKHAAAMKKVQESVEYKNKQSESQKRAQNKKETRMKRSASLKKRWEEIGFKSMMIASRENSEILKSAEFKEEECSRNREIANMQSVKNAKSKFNKYYHNKPEIAERKRKKMISYWSNPENLLNRIDNEHGAYYDYELPSGSVARVQGYEPKALDKLLETFKETDIVVGTRNIINEIGGIKYIYNDNEHVYYPDMFIKSTNTIIEVKSQWTFDKWKEKNLAKERACLEQGFNFEFMIL